MGKGTTDGQGRSRPRPAGLRLTALWMAGLVLVNGSFLGAAIPLHRPEWLRVVLVLASIANVPLFLWALMATRRDTLAFPAVADAGKDEEPVADAAGQAAPAVAVAEMPGSPG